MADWEDQTHFAMQAVGLSAGFRAKVGDRIVEGAVRYRPELAAPDGPSTGGGTQSVQHIKLVPVYGKGAVLVAGSANSVERVVELRSYDHMAQLHAQRFRGQRIQLDRARYNALLRRMQAFFGEQRMSVVMTRSAPGTPGSRPGTPNQGRVVLLVAGIAFAVGGALYLILSMKH